MAPRTARAIPALCLAAGCFSAASLSAQDHAAIARRVLERAPLIDGHNDLPWAIRERGGLERGAAAVVAGYDLRARAPGHTDLERLRRGMVSGQFWSVYVDCESAGAGAARVQLEQIAIARAVIDAHPEAFRLALTAAVVDRSFRDRRIASLLGMEGAHALEGSVTAMRAYRDLGVRYLGLTHNCTNEFADAALGAARHGGLSPLGVELVKELNRLGVLVDLAHASAAAMHDALDASAAPVIWSHASARALVDHARNVPDDVLRRLPANGGVVMITFVPAYVSAEHMAWDAAESAESDRLERTYGEGDPRVRAELETWRRAHPAPPATLAQVADHIDHVRRIAGVDHVGIGSDFDGISRVVRGLEDVSTYPPLFAELSRRGWREPDLAKLAGGNVLRALRGAEETARRLAREGAR
jgi:membrane dipeptidase